jgi:hypothetical protein
VKDNLILQITTIFKQNIDFTTEKADGKRRKVPNNRTISVLQEAVPEQRPTFTLKDRESLLGIRSIWNISA